jgi:plastocyanin
MIRSLHPRSRRLAAAGLAAALALALGACGGDDDDGGATGSGSPSGTGSATGTDDNGAGDDTDAVVIEGFAFDAQPVAAATEFEVENRDSADHTFTADDGEFGVTVEGGDSVDVTAPSEPGTYAFHCELHSDMTGELTVQ